MERCIVVARYKGKTETFTLSFEEERRSNFVATHRLTLERDAAGVFLRGTGLERRLRPDEPEVFEYIGVPVTAILRVG
jgi:hypothetical protein